MANKVKINDQQGTQVFPITHVSAVLDNFGNSVEQVLGAQTDLINQAQLEIGAVPSDLNPTKDSSHWVTSGGVWNAVNVDNSEETDYDVTDCTVDGKVMKADGSFQSTSVAGYSVTDYIQIPSWASKIIYNDIVPTSTNFAYGYLFNGSKVPLQNFGGNGEIDLSDYPTAAFVVFGITPSTQSAPSVKITSGDAFSVKEKVVELSEAFDEEMVYDDSSGTQVAGYANTEMDGTAGSGYYAWGVVDSVAEHDGTIRSVSFDAASSGTIKFMVGTLDTTHGYFDIRATHNYTISSTGNQTISVNMPIKKGETLMVNIHDGIKIRHRSYTTPPTGAKKAIASTDGGETYHVTGTLYVYLSWAIDWENYVTLKDKVVENTAQMEALNDADNVLSQQVSELASSKLLIEGNDGKVYRLVVNNGVLGVECTTPQNILILAHSFACILTGVWQRGMSSSRVETDWVSQINSVFLGNVQRVNMVTWEQAFPNPASTLSGLLDSYLTSSIDAIFIMCGANVPSAYRTQAYGQTNFAALVNYCKTRSINADIYVCSPGYTPETDGFNIGIKAGAESEGATYISTYSTQSDKLANYGDVVYAADSGTYSFVINSSGRVNHPNDIWHLYMANNILSALGYNTLDKYHNISYNTSVQYRGYTRWVAGGHCTVCTFGNTQPTVSIVDSDNNNISFNIMDLSSVTWDNIPPSIPTYAIHFQMPNKDVTISIS